MFKIKEPKEIFTAVDVIQAGNSGLVWGILIGLVAGFSLGMMAWSLVVG